ncbi:MAG: hypothetical protein MZV64_15870 [Ignavibacteriales bacterium]|nr:hypothetical protein [Ignavibacteriales bacterium]
MTDMEPPMPCPFGDEAPTGHQRLPRRLAAPCGISRSLPRFQRSPGRSCQSPPDFACQHDVQSNRRGYAVVGLGICRSGERPAALLSTSAVATTSMSPAALMMTPSAIVAAVLSASRKWTATDAATLVPPLESDLLPDSLSVLSLALPRLLSEFCVGPVLVSEPVRLFTKSDLSFRFLVGISCAAVLGARRRPCPRWPWPTRRRHLPWIRQS